MSYEFIDNIISDFKKEKLSSDESWEQKFISSLKSQIKIEDYGFKEISEKIIMVIGVNGTGKTTTSAKLSNYYKNNGDKVMLIGADTYRAAAV